MTHGEAARGPCIPARPWGTVWCWDTHTPPDQHRPGGGALTETPKSRWQEDFPSLVPGSAQPRTEAISPFYRKEKLRHRETRKTGAVCPSWGDRPLAPGHCTQSALLPPGFPWFPRGPLFEGVSPGGKDSRLCPLLFLNHVFESNLRVVMLAPRKGELYDPLQAELSSPGKLLGGFPCL